jgi:hypothetical protein
LKQNAFEVIALPGYKQRKIQLVVLGLIIAGSIFGNDLIGHLDYQNFIKKIDSGSKCEVPQMISSQDQNQNGIPDAIDFVKGARLEVERGTVYDGSYFQGGYPPDGKGACTDVIWRAFKVAGYDLKKMVDGDIKNFPEAYGATGSHPDPNIDFRRVRNLQIFFERQGEELTTMVVPGDVTNLSSWQPGDIVVFGMPLEHIGIISDRRGRDGVPQMIHNCGPQASEGNYLLSWNSKMTYHFRFIRLEASKSSL